MVIVADSYGRLGNRLFVFACLAAAGAEHGFSVWNPGFGEYAHLFPAVDRDPLCRFPARSTRLPRNLRGAAFFTARVLARLRVLPLVRQHGDEVVDIGAPAFVARARRRPLLVQGWLFRDPESLRAQADAVRAHFRPAAKHEEAVEQVLERARRGVDVLVGVHVRRGDYDVFMDGRYLWSVEAYRTLMARLRDLHRGRRVRFLVCSDEPVDLRDFGGLEVTLGTGAAVEDLYAFAGCDLLIGPPSTFTGWAAFYGDVPIVFVEDPEAPLSLPATA